MSGESVRPNVVFVLGAPGAGKGTQCERINKEFGFVHLSAGDLLRAEQKRETENATLIRDCIKEGAIVPVAITCQLLLNAMKESQHNNFLIDGFPRNKDNLDGWNSTVGDRVNLQFVLFFECDPQVGVDRCMKRGVSSGRTDDNPESLKKRIVTYLENTMPIIQHYEKIDKVQRINAVRTPDEVFGDVQKLFKSLISSN
ncbi:UMP-CMP kinase-like [Tubulanus polymorphus]|uniref:UMP-CMP kinase-like n=1 Tax=Tubulanus polymorphus TaxID=672921 RepID=UPI003DA48FE0